MWIDLMDVAWAGAAVGVFVLTAFGVGYTIGHFANWNEGFDRKDE